MEIIAVADLKIGMFVVEPDCPWTDLPFALQGFVVSKLEQIDVFQQKCRFVSIDRSRSLNEHYAAPKSERGGPLQSRGVGGAPERTGGRLKHREAEQAQQERRRQRRQRFLDFLHTQDDNEDGVALSRELACVEPHFDEFAVALRQAMTALQHDGELDLHAIRDNIREVAGSLRRNADAVMWLLRLKRQDEYSFDHALDVSVTMLLVGIHIGWREQQLNQLGLAGLLQDVGKIQLPPELLGKTGDLSGEERELVRSHVASSLEMLVSQKGVPAEVLAIVSRHHERWDGSGYPRGLRGEMIGLGSEIAGLADSYCAMVKDKPYRAALGHQEALEELHAQRGRQFGPVLMEQFVQCIGLYPIGCLVELDGGEVGVVIQQNRIQRARPRVLVMLDRDKQPLQAYRVIDLRAEQHAARRIARSLPARAHGLLANDYFLG